MCTLANSEECVDLNETTHYAAFHLGLHYLEYAKTKTIFRERNVILFGNYSLWHLDIYNGPFQVYCIKPEMSQCLRFSTMWYVRPAKPQISLHMGAV